MNAKDDDLRETAYNVTYTAAYNAAYTAAYKDSYDKDYKAYEPIFNASVVAMETAKTKAKAAYDAIMNEALADAKIRDIDNTAAEKAAHFKANEAGEKAGEAAYKNAEKLSYWSKKED